MPFILIPRNDHEGNVPNRREKTQRCVLQERILNARNPIVRKSVISVFQEWERKFRFAEAKLINAFIARGVEQHLTIQI